MTTAALCPSTPSLRAHLDEPDALLEAHADGCATCRGALAELAATAGIAAAAVRQLQAGDGPEAAAAAALLQRLRAVAPAEPAPVVALRRPSRMPRFAAAAGVALVAVAVAVTPAGRGAVAQVLDLFRAERLQVVVFDAGVVPEAYEHLGPLADVSGRPADPQAVPDLAAAETLAGIVAPAVDPSAVPAGFGEPAIFAAAPSQVRLTFDRAASPELPATLDGVTLVVDLPGTIAQVWGPAAADLARPAGDLAQPAPSAGRSSLPPGRVLGPPGDLSSEAVLEALPVDGERSGRGLPHAGGAADRLGMGTLVVGAAGALAVSAEGAPLEDVRAALLGSGLLPPDLAAQLAAIPDWRTTLPLPVPSGSIAWRDADVAGQPGFVFGDASGLAAAVVWQDAGRVLGVGGTVTDAAALQVARTLR